MILSNLIRDDRRLDFYFTQSNSIMEIAKWTKQDLQLLRQLWPTNSCKAIAQRIGRSPGAVKSKAKALKLLKASGYNRNADRTLSPEEVNFLKENYLRYPNPILSKMMNRAESTLIRYSKILGIKGKENTGRIKPGSIPPNKGKKMPPGWGGETRFKKGQIPHNVKFDGCISIRKNKNRKPYVWIRIGIKRWEELHRYVWEKTVGPIPKGINIQFKDKNTLNCNPSNLYMVTRDKQILENSIHRYDPELISIIRLAGKLKRKIKSYEEQN